MRLDEVKKYLVCISVYVQTVRDKNLKRSSFSSRISQRWSACIKIRSHRDGLIHNSFLQINQHDAWDCACYLTSCLGVGSADRGVASNLFMSVAQIKLSQADLIQRWRCNQQNLRVMSFDPFMCDNLG